MKTLSLSIPPEGNRKNKILTTGLGCVPEDWRGRGPCGWSVGMRMPGPEMPPYQLINLPAPISWMLKKTRDSWDRVNPASSKRIVFVSVPFVPQVLWGQHRWARWMLYTQRVCVQARSTSVFTTSGKTTLFPGERQYLTQLT